MKITASPLTRVLCLLMVVAACGGGPVAPTAQPPVSAGLPSAAPSSAAQPSAATSSAGPTGATPATPSVPSPSAEVSAQPTAAATESPQAGETATPPVASEAPQTPVPSAAGACPPRTGPTTHATSITSPETWTAAQSPHIVKYDLVINAALTLEPCAEVRLPAGSTMLVGGTGSLLATGDAEHHIVITADQPDAPFAAISARSGGTLSLSYVDISYGGDPGNSQPFLTGTVYLQGADGTQPTQPTVFVDHVTIDKSASNGIVLRDGAGFVAGSTDLSVKGAAAWPVSVWARAAGTLPDGTYVGNGTDQIMLTDADGGGAVLEDVTLRNLGVPYLVGTEFSHGGLRVSAPFGSTETSVLTLQPGVQLLFRAGGIMEIEHFTGDFPARGALAAVGTQDQPIIFGSAVETPAAGDWYGLRYGLIPSDLNSIQYARIEYAGAEIGVPSDCHANTHDFLNGAGVIIYGRPPGEFITNSTIFASAGHGIARAWTGKRVDFKPTNTFDQVAGCDQT